MTKSTKLTSRLLILPFLMLSFAGCEVLSSGGGKIAPNEVPGDGVEPTDDALGFCSTYAGYFADNSGETQRVNSACEVETLFVRQVGGLFPNVSSETVCTYTMTGVIEEVVENSNTAVDDADHEIYISYFTIELTSAEQDADCDNFLDNMTELVNAEGGAPYSSPVEFLDEDSFRLHTSGGSTLDELFVRQN